MRFKDALPTLVMAEFALLGLAYGLMLLTHKDDNVWGNFLLLNSIYWGAAFVIYFTIKLIKKGHETKSNR